MGEPIRLNGPSPQLTHASTPGRSTGNEHGTFRIDEDVLSHIIQVGTAEAGHLTPDRWLSLSVLVSKDARAQGAIETAPDQYCKSHRRQEQQPASKA